MVHHAGALEERQEINIADSQTVTLVKAGTSAIPGNVVGIDESTVKTIRGIVDRVAVCVGKAESQITHSASRRGLKSMVTGIGHILQSSDVPKTEKWTQRIWIIPAGDAQIVRCLPGDGHTTWRSQRSAVIVAVSADSFARFVRIRRGAH